LLIDSTLNVFKFSIILISLLFLNIHVHVYGSVASVENEFGMCYKEVKN